MDKDFEKVFRLFLIEAKKQTYANASIKKEKSSRMGSNDYHYEKESMVYHDTYFGGTQFIGEEVVYMDSEVPCWAMNYYGVTIDSSLSEEAMDMVLRLALMLVGDDETVLPVRGPSQFCNGDYMYTFKCKGNLVQFEGVEEITKNGKVIYRLQCHGGLVK